MPLRFGAGLPDAVPCSALREGRRTDVARDEVLPVMVTLRTYSTHEVKTTAYTRASGSKATARQAPRSNIRIAPRPGFARAEGGGIVEGGKKQKGLTGVV